MSWACYRLLRRPILWVCFCLSPFFWFYLNEARPYIALLAFTGVATVALLAYLLYRSDYKGVAPWCCLVALLFAWGTHIMAAFSFPSLVVFAVANLATEPEVKRNFFKDWRFTSTQSSSYSEPELQQRFEGQKSCQQHAFSFSAPNSA
jgi:hypothetical protein